MAKRYLVTARLTKQGGTYREIIDIDEAELDNLPDGVAAFRSRHLAKRHSTRPITDPPLWAQDDFIDEE